jgi:aspartate/methionine/tyrosine aminotransferase
MISALSLSQPQLSHGARAVPRSGIREIAEIAMQMEGVLPLYFGEARMPPPDCAQQAGINAIASGSTYYTANAGMPSLREAIAEHYAERYQVQLDSNREIVVTASGVQALNVAIHATLDPGDEALILTPNWPNASAIVVLAKGVVRQIPFTLSERQYAIDFEALEAAVTKRTRAMIYTSPSNPLGWVASVADQRRLLDFCRRHGLWLIADEVYDRLYLDGAYHGAPAPSILRSCTRDDAVIVVQSMSKAYCMTGWRIGWLVGRSDFARNAAQLNECVISSASTIAQKAAEAALSEGEQYVSDLVTFLHKNRDLCIAALRDLPGVTVPKPAGAFYVFPKIEGLQDSMRFCRQLLLEMKVGLAPGIAFGNGGEGSLRICYGVDRSVLEPALERLVRFLTTAVFT